MALHPAEDAPWLLRRVLTFATRQDDQSQGAQEAQEDRGIGIVSFLAALAVALVIFGVQTLLFLLLRNKLARIL
jgi:calcium permeable stress-gated cation channel